MKSYQTLQEIEFELCYYGNFQPSEVLEMEVSEIDWKYKKLIEKKRKELEIEAAKRGINV